MSDQLTSSELPLIIKALESITKIKLDDIDIETELKAFIKLISGINDIGDMGQFEPMISPAYEDGEYKYLSSLREDVASEPDTAPKEYEAPKIL